MEETLFLGLGGAFMLLDTYGFPLAMFCDEVEKRGRFRTAMDIFVYDALVSGWSFEKAISTVWETWATKYGPRKADELIAILKIGCMRAITGGILRTHVVTKIGLIVCTP